MFGWDTFKKDPWFFVGATLILSIFSIVVNWLTGADEVVFSPIGFVIGFLASTVVTIAYARMALSANEGQHVSWEGLWAPEHFWRMLGATILQTVIIVIGFILLIIPGIIASLMLCFTQLLVVDRKMGPVEAIKESYEITKGQLFRLFLFMIAICLLNFVGLIALVVGLLVTVPVSLIAIAHVYKKLSALKSVPIVTSAPVPPPAA